LIGLREVQRLAYQTKVAEQTIERDYVLTWMLAEIARHPSLGQDIIFKGGTAIKKLFFEEWRYSEDLDFTLYKPSSPETLVTALNDVGIACKKNAGLEIAVSSQEVRRNGHLRSLTVYLSYLGPLRRTRRRRKLKVDITADEIIVETPIHRPIIQVYSDEYTPAVSVLTYPLDEILAEKMRTLLQRTEPRDLYDVWMLLSNYKNEFDLMRAQHIFGEKCRFKGITVSDNFLSGRRAERFAAAWDRRLREQVEDLPSINAVMRQMRRLMRTQWT